MPSVPTRVQGHKKFRNAVAGASAHSSQYAIENMMAHRPWHKHVLLSDKPQIRIPGTMAHVGCTSPLTAASQHSKHGLAPGVPRPAMVTHLSNNSVALCHSMPASPQPLTVAAWYNMHPRLCAQVIPTSPPGALTRPVALRCVNQGSGCPLVHGGEVKPTRCEHATPIICLDKSFA